MLVKWVSGKVLFKEVKGPNQDTSDAATEVLLDNIPLNIMVRAIHVLADVVAMLSAAINSE